MDHDLYQGFQLWVFGIQSNHKKPVNIKDDAFEALRYWDTIMESLSAYSKAVTC
jgi:hypothetical protein